MGKWTECMGKRKKPDPVEEWRGGEKVGKGNQKTKYRPTASKQLENMESSG